jgi:hypothetical protein
MSTYSIITHKKYNLNAKCDLVQGEHEVRPYNVLNESAESGLAGFLLCSRDDENLA